jgi:hypothetical protein
MDAIWNNQIVMAFYNEFNNICEVGNIYDMNLDDEKLTWK